MNNELKTRLDGVLSRLDVLGFEKVSAKIREAAATPFPDPQLKGKKMEFPAGSKTVGPIGRKKILGLLDEQNKKYSLYNKPGEQTQGEAADPDMPKSRMEAYTFIFGESDDAIAEFKAAPGIVGDWWNDGLTLSIWNKDAQGGTEYVPIFKDGGQWKPVPGAPSSKSLEEGIKFLDYKSGGLSRLLKKKFDNAVAHMEKAVHSYAQKMPQRGQSTQTGPTQGPMAA